MSSQVNTEDYKQYLEIDEDRRGETQMDRGRERDKERGRKRDEHAMGERRGIAVSPSFKG